LQSVVEGPGANGNGSIEPGEKITVSFALTTDAGASFPINRVDGLNALISGPSGNSNLVLETAIPTAKLAGASPFTLELPERDELEFVGNASAALGDVFATSKTPHWNVAGALTVVRVRTATGGGSSATIDVARPPQNFVDVADSTGFARDDFVVVDDGVANREEYLRIQFVDGNRLWFGSPASPTYKPALVFTHSSGASVKEVALTTKNAGSDYSLNAATGEITELSEFGAGNAVVVSYTTDFTMPSDYPPPENDSPDLDMSVGEWRGLSLVAGTYRAELSAYCDLNLNAQGEDNSYRYAAPASARDFLVGGATALEPYALISSGDNCLACHQDLVYHGGTWRGFDACITCHACAGSEDRPRYVSANAPATKGVTVNFRTLLHEIHRGQKLANAATFKVIGAGSAPYPDDFAVKNYAQYLFPALPDRTAQCAKCHGASNQSWIAPADRSHPTEQTIPLRAWKAACETCHDSDADVAHVDAMTSPSGAESCTLCHAPGATWEVETEHANR
jgi:hypothetical protein